MTIAPCQKPSSTPAAVDTMLDGIGSTTSLASRAAIDTAAIQRALSPAVTRSANALNCDSNRKNGTSTNAIRMTVITVQRIAMRYDDRRGEISYENCGD